MFLHYIKSALFELALFKVLLYLNKKLFLLPDRGSPHEGHQTEGIKNTYYPFFSTTLEVVTLLLAKAAYLDQSLLFVTFLVLFLCTMGRYIAGQKG